MLSKALVVRQLIKAGKTVYVMHEGGKLTHTIRSHNVDKHSLVGVYKGKTMSAEEINDDLHFVLNEWRKGR